MIPETIILAAFVGLVLAQIAIWLSRRLARTRATALSDEDVCATCGRGWDT